MKKILFLIVLISIYLTVNIFINNHYETAKIKKQELIQIDVSKLLKYSLSTI